MYVFCRVSITLRIYLPDCSKNCQPFPPVLNPSSLKWNDYHNKGQVYAEKKELLSPMLGFHEQHIYLFEQTTDFGTVSEQTQRMQVQLLVRITFFTKGIPALFALIGEQTFATICLCLFALFAVRWNPSSMHHPARGEEWMQKHFLDISCW